VQIKCTGQKPASDLVSTLSAALISPSGTILVNEHLQVADPKYANVYALGDVAETKSLKMGRAASMQAFFVADNICRSIRGQPLKQFRPTIFDRAIELTLGLVRIAMRIWTMDSPCGRSTMSPTSVMARLIYSSTKLAGTMLCTPQ